MFETLVTSQVSCKFSGGPFWAWVAQTALVRAPVSWTSPCFRVMSPPTCPRNRELYAGFKEQATRQPGRNVYLDATPSAHL